MCTRSQAVASMYGTMPLVPASPKLPAKAAVVTGRPAAAVLKLRMASRSSWRRGRGRAVVFTLNLPVPNSISKPRR